MNRLYRNTFDQIVMPEDRAQALRTALASHCSPPETEVISMNKQKFLRRPASFLVAILLIAALSITALACGGRVLYRVLSEDEIPPVTGPIHDLTGQDIETIPYEFTEENGEILVTFPVGD